MSFLERLFRWKKNQENQEKQESQQEQEISSSDEPLIEEQLESINEDEEEIKDLPQDFRYFNNAERIVILRGLEKLYNHLINSPLEKLPRVLIFPETSGRVACWLTKPIFDYVYRRRNLPSPFIYLLK